MPEPLNDQQIQQALQPLGGWRHEENQLKRDLKFSTFEEAISFILRLSFEASKRDHHPELHNVYNRVSIALTSHDAGSRVTRKDVELAEAIHHFNWRGPDQPVAEAG